MTTDQGPFPRANAGDPLRIPASAWNRIRDATIKVERGGSNIGKVNGDRTNPREVIVKNATVTDLDRYDIMGVSIPLFGPDVNLTEFQTNLCMQGVACDGEEHIGRWAVLMEPIAAGQIGMAIISGETIAMIDVLDANDTHVECNTDPSDTGNFYRLQSGTTGTARILWKESGTGNDKWALIRIGDAAGGGDAAGSSPFRVKSIQNDYLTCRTWDGTTDGSTDVYVAKPFLLRHALANYSTISSFTTVNSQQATVIAIADSVTYTWRVVMPYAVNDVIWAHRTTLGDVTVSSQPVTWEDDAKCRIWAVLE